MVTTETLSVNLTSSVVGAIFGALVNHQLARWAAKKNPKTEERAKAYDAIVVHIFNSIEGDTVVRNAQRDRELISILAKLSLFGEPKVVKAASIFTSKYLHSGVGTDSVAILPLIKAMRESLVTGSTSVTMDAIETIVHSLQETKNIGILEAAVATQSTAANAKDA